MKTKNTGTDHRTATAILITRRHLTRNIDSVDSNTLNANQTGCHKELKGRLSENINSTNINELSIHQQQLMKQYFIS